MPHIKDTDLVPLDDPGSARARSILDAQGISLTPEEIERVRSLLGRNPTLVELHIFNTMWSEHCSYKSSKPLLRKYLPTDGPHVVLGPGEDAGIVRFARIDGRSLCLVMAHESHNHPSQVLPYEGAATGIGGIVRDVYCMGADVVGVMDPLRFGDPDGPNGRRTREIAMGVVGGIAGYANPLGVPNLGGDTIFDPSYDDNCLVNVVALGVVDEERIVRSRAPGEAAEMPYAVILLGKPTDASGFGGAAFASGRLSSDENIEKQEAVQVPDPFLKRVLAEATKKVLALAAREGIAIGFKDLGAGGISCAVSEMAASADLGASIDLDRVNKASESLPPEVTAVSETQERYIMIVPAAAADRVVRIYNEDFDLPGLYPGAGAFVIGEVTREKRFRIEHRGKVVCDAGVHAITSGIEYERRARPRKPRRLAPLRSASHRAKQADGVEGILLALLSGHNVSDKELVFHRYDTEVQGRAVLRPGEADACVQVFLPGSRVGLVAAVGGSPRLAAVDPRLGGTWAVCEAARNVCCAGALPLAVTDCLNFGDPEDEHVFWEFSEAVRGIGEACRSLRLGGEISGGIPVVSGNVSFYNQSEDGEPIAPSPIVACAGRVDDVSRVRGMGFKRNDSAVFLLGALHPNLGGSEFEMMLQVGGYPAWYSEENASPPRVDFELEVAILRALIEGFESGRLLAAHDVSLGGFLVAAAEMLLASPDGEVGCKLDLAALVPGDDEGAAYLFSEFGGVIVEVASGGRAEFEKSLRRLGAPYMVIGETCAGGGLKLGLRGGTVDIAMARLREAFKGDLGRVFGA
jgi:phosphoribosylformylglycinamidine synthase